MGKERNILGCYDCTTRKMKDMIRLDTLSKALNILSCTSLPLGLQVLFRFNLLHLSEVFLLTYFLLKKKKKVNLPLHLVLIYSVFAKDQSKSYIHSEQIFISLHSKFRGTEQFSCVCPGKVYLTMCISTNVSLNLSQ